MIDSRFKEFVTGFNDRVRELRSGEPDAEGVLPIRPREEAFTEVFIEDMTDVGLLGDAEVHHFEDKIGRANAKVNGYAVSDDGGELTLITTLFGGESDRELRAAPAGEIQRAVKAALQVFRGAVHSHHQKMENSRPQWDMMERIHSLNGGFDLVRVLVVVNGAGSKVPELEQEDDIPRTMVDVWDLERLFRAVSSGLAYESLEVDVESLIGNPLPCLEGPSTADDHRCFLAIVPGDLLHRLYQEHGARLLELNVRSFLQAKGKVNRGIRDTLLNDPGHFLPFNNGISATVESLELVDLPAKGVGIRKLTGLQIVNGGQTMASIHRAKERDKVELSRVHVQTKITMIKPDLVDQLVPMISRCSNTQNKVNETDFSANHPFHVKFQQLSEQVWLPGETTRWFYERARGQYEVARSRDGQTPAKLRAFDIRTPKTKKLDKTALAQAMNAWDEKPHIVGLGGQKCFVAFMSSLTSRGSAWLPDEDYYKDAIAKVLIFRRAEKIARQIGFQAYRANAVAYTVGLLAFRCCGRLDLRSVWTNQNVSDAVDKTMREWMPRVHEEIVGTADGRNVTEWGKKKECWAMVQSLDLELADGLEGELGEGQPRPNVGRFSEGRGSTSKPLSEVERDRQAKVMKLGAQEWQELVAWMRTDERFSGFPISLCSTILGYAAAGWEKVPSPKQTKYLVGYIGEWNEVREEMKIDDE